MSTWTLEGALAANKVVPKTTPPDYLLNLDGLKVPSGEQKLTALLKKHQIEPAGVLHLGAHYGHELETYLQCGFRNIVYVEANPHIFPVIKKRIDFWSDWTRTLKDAYGLTPPTLRAVHAAVGLHDGPVKLHRTEYDMQASLLRPQAQDIREVECIEVPGMRVDSLLLQEGFEAGDFCLLHMDIQGAEIMAMESAPRLLEKLRMVLTEVNYEPRYENCPSPDDMDHFLTTRGFRLISRTGPFPESNYPVGDALYVRE